MSSMTLNADDVIGSGENAYAILEEVGRGAAGVVYKARPVTRPDDRVALKLIEGLGNLDAQLMEPEILSRLRHPNIIHLFDYFLAFGKLALVMEFVAGQDLNTFFKSRSCLSSTEVRAFLTQMASALALAHGQGIVHRDIKPNNILVTEERGQRRYVLADFGISRQAEGIQFTRQLVGSYYFMAPEQLRGRADAQSDLWSLGVVGYWLLTGRLPFEGRTLQELSEQVSLMSPTAPRVLNREVDPDLEVVILELLQKDPIRRIGSATALLERLAVQPASQFFADPLRPVVSPSWEMRLEQAIRYRKRLFWIFLVLWMVPELILAPALVTWGAYKIYLHQARLPGRQHPVVGLSILAAGWICLFLTGFAQGLAILWLNRSGILSLTAARALFSLEYYGNFALSIVAAFVMAYNYARWQLLEREQFLLNSLRVNSPDCLALIDTLRAYLIRNPEELFVRQRLTELLSFTNRPRDAIVEAKLALFIDPYNFAISLLLGESYFQVGLLGEAIAVCDGYLAVSPQSFEFGDLRRRCLEARQKGSL
jgi:tRNA A-37 threonylcarbamoyl transferase component Bud32